MEFNSFSVILSLIVLVIFVECWYKNSVKHMDELTHNIPVVERIPWREMILHIFSKEKSSNYSKSQLKLSYVSG